MAYFYFDLSYYLGKENVVVDAMSKHGGREPEYTSLRNNQILCMIREYKEVESLTCFDFETVLMLRLEVKRPLSER